MKLLIVRHGETYDNVNEIVGGHRPGKLTPKGKKQARAAALKLKSEQIDTILSSDLKRAKDTAKEIAKFHQVPINYTKDLRERHLGVFQGKHHEFFWASHSQTPESIIKYKPKNGESWIELKKRISRLTKTLYPKYSNKTVLIVTHAGVSQVLLSIYLRTPINTAMHTWPKNGGVLTLNVTKSTARVLKNTLI